jgi:hypothetical protein
MYKFIGNDMTYHGSLNGDIGTILAEHPYNSPDYCYFHPLHWDVRPEGPVCAIVRTDALVSL